MKPVPKVHMVMGWVMDSICGSDRRLRQMATGNSVLTTKNRDEVTCRKCNKILEFRGKAILQNGRGSEPAGPSLDGRPDAEHAGDNVVAQQNGEDEPKAGAGPQNEGNVPG